MPVIEELSQLYKININNSYSLHDLIETISKKKVIKFDENTSECHEILINLEQAIKMAYNHHVGGDEIEQGKNERTNVLSIIRQEFIKCLSKTGYFTVKSLGKGYPHFQLRISSGKYIFLGIRTSQKETSMIRELYCSKNKLETIKYDGYHLGVSFNYYKETSEDRNTAWWEIYKIADFFDLPFNIKFEYNAIFDKSRIIRESKSEL